MSINIIAAVASNLALGYKNKLIYWLPDDLKRFKQLTTGHTILMGRKTFESLPKGALPNRRNVVITKTENVLPGCDIYHSIEEAIKSCRNDEEVYVIGGATIYEQMLPIADKLCLTEIKDTPENADVFFPEYRNDWEEIWSEEHDIDEKHSQRFRFVDYKRK